MPKKKTPEIVQWKNRITGYGEKPAKEFKFNPLNWRTHSAVQRSAIDGVLSQIGWVTGVIENQTTGNLIDGHARIEEALSKNPDQTIPFVKVELSEDEERKILRLLDPIGALAGTDAEKLKELIEGLEFDSSVFDAILAQNSITDIDLGDFFVDKTPDQSEKKHQIILEYKKDDFDFVSAKLSALAENYSDAVKKLLQ